MHIKKTDKAIKKGYKIFILVIVIVLFISIPLGIYMMANNCRTIQDVVSPMIGYCCIILTIKQLSKKL